MSYYGLFQTKTTWKSKLYENENVIRDKYFWFYQLKLFVSLLTIEIFYVTCNF